MSSIRTTIHESLPYIDAEPTPAERAAAQALIDAELSSSPPPDPSSSILPPLRAPKFTPLAAAEQARVASSSSPPAPLDAIDLSRYEATSSSSSSDPSSSSPSSSDPSPSSQLRRAAISSVYLSQRSAHLALLDAHGRHAWLVANWQLEAELAGLERDLAAARRDVDLVALARRRAQDGGNGGGGAAELHTLGEDWRRGVARVLETEAAAEDLRRQVLERQRRGAAAGGAAAAAAAS
ncbi:Pre-mRNA-splicing factor SPF27 [Xylariaceae sp. FL0804]|nr:Pre-mRNA-splicing factor SPF27 [Xylariaceae sp. FL0804]